MLFVFVTDGAGRRTVLLGRFRPRVPRSTRRIDLPDVRFRRLFKPRRAVLSHAVDFAAELLKPQRAIRQGALLSGVVALKANDCLASQAAGAQFVD